MDVQKQTVKKTRGDKKADGDVKNYFKWRISLVWVKRAAWLI